MTANGIKRLCPLCIREWMRTSHRAARATKSIQMSEYERKLVRSPRCFAFGLAGILREAVVLGTPDLIVKLEGWIEANDARLEATKDDPTKS